MTDQEAIEIIKYASAFNKDNSPLTKALEIGIKAIEEIQQYKEIGTVEECREAREKQEEKKPDYEGDGYADGHIVYDTWICPCCGERYEIDYEEYEHCPKCGQAIDRSEENE